MRLDHPEPALQRRTWPLTRSDALHPLLGDRAQAWADVFQKFLSGLEAGFVTEWGGTVGPNPRDPRIPFSGQAAATYIGRYSVEDPLDTELFLEVQSLCRALRDDLCAIYGGVSATDSAAMKKCIAELSEPPGQPLPIPTS